MAVLSSLGVNGCLAYEAALLGTTVPANGIMLTRSANPGGMIHTNYLRDSFKSIDRSLSPQSCSDSRQHFSAIVLGLILFGVISFLWMVGPEIVSHDWLRIGTMCA